MEVKHTGHGQSNNETRCSMFTAFKVLCFKLAAMYIHEEEFLLQSANVAEVILCTGKFQVLSALGKPSSRQTPVRNFAQDHTNLYNECMSMKMLLFICK